MKGVKILDKSENLISELSKTRTGKRRGSRRPGVEFDGNEVLFLFLFETLAGRIKRMKSRETTR